jgi:hypothetical protein
MRNSADGTLRGGVDISAGCLDKSGSVIGGSRERQCRQVIGTVLRDQGS